MLFDIIRKNKIFISIFCIISLFLTSITFGATISGKWVKENDRYKWLSVNDYDKDSSDIDMLPYGWHWLDGDNDHVCECYFIDIYGYRLDDTISPDGYKLDKRGRWTVKGKVQLKFIEQPGVTLTDEILKKLTTESQIYVTSPSAIDMYPVSTENNIVGLSREAIIKRIDKLGGDFEIYKEIDSNAALMQYLKKLEEGMEETIPGEKITDQEWLRRYLIYKREKRERERYVYREYETTEEYEETLDPGKVIEPTETTPSSVIIAVKPKK